MADAKKPDKGKPAGGKPPAKPAPAENSMESTIVLVVIVAVMLLFIVLPAILQLFGYTGPSIFTADLWTKITEGFMAFISAISYVSIFLSLLFMCGIIYAQVMYGEYKKQLEEMSAPKKPILRAELEDPGPQNMVNKGPDPRWRDIEGLMQSGNTADWRIAILEADIMLEDMLTQMGYMGDSIGDKLKQVDRSHFKSLNDAWNAHKVRNTIAHEGAAFQLSRTEADNTIAMFKRVFDEFYFV